MHTMGSLICLALIFAQFIGHLASSFLPQTKGDPSSTPSKGKNGIGARFLGDRFQPKGRFEHHPNSATRQEQRDRRAQIERDAKHRF